ncbi:MAG: hypothetical protein ACOYB1_18625 [Limnohabitans sp.]
MSGHEIKECNVAHDGVCALHGVEVERRKHTAQIVENIPVLLTTMNRIIGYSVLVTMVVAGGFVYIRDVKQQVDYSHEMHKSDITLITSHVSALTTAVARSEEKYSSILREMENLNNQVRLIVSNDSARQQQKRKP